MNLEKFLESYHRSWWLKICQIEGLWKTITPMPSPLHEGVIELLRNHPQVLLKLLAPFVPEFQDTAWEVASHPQTDFTDVNLAVVIITLDEAVAGYYRQKIDLGFGRTIVHPFVLGPKEIPWIASSEEARKNPGLATLSVIAHTDKAGVEEVAFAAILALASVEDLDEGTRLAYYDIIRGSLNEIAKVALERLMQERGREYISDFCQTLLRPRT